MPPQLPLSMCLLLLLQPLQRWQPAVMPLGHPAQVPAVASQVPEQQRPFAHRSAPCAQLATQAQALLLLLLLLLLPPLLLQLLLATQQLLIVDEA